MQPKTLFHDKFQVLTRRRHKKKKIEFQLDTTICIYQIVMKCYASLPRSACAISRPMSLSDRMGSDRIGYGHTIRFRGGRQKCVAAAVSAVYGTVKTRQDVNSLVGPVVVKGFHKETARSTRSTHCQENLSYYSTAHCYAPMKSTATTG